MTDAPEDWVLIEAAKRSDLRLDVKGIRNIYPDRFSPAFVALCDMIAKHEQPPVDRKLLCARQALHEGRTIEEVSVRAIELFEEGFGK